MKFGLNVVQRLFFGGLGIFCVSESGKYDILFVEMSYREGGGIGGFVCLSFSTFDGDKPLLCKMSLSRPTNRENKRRIES